MNSTEQREKNRLKAKAWRDANPERARELRRECAKRRRASGAPAKPKAPPKPKPAPPPARTTPYTGPILCMECRHWSFSFCAARKRNDYVFPDPDKPTLDYGYVPRSAKCFDPK